MRKLLAELPLRRIIFVSILLGALISGIDTRADEAWVCRTEVSGCSNEGCHNSKPDGSGFIVCLYFGNNCPPLNQCDNDGVIQ